MPLASLLTSHTKASYREQQDIETPTYTNSPTREHVNVSFDSWCVAYHHLVGHKDSELKSWSGVFERWPVQNEKQRLFYLGGKNHTRYTGPMCLIKPITRKELKSAFKADLITICQRVKVNHWSCFRLHRKGSDMNGDITIADVNAVRSKLHY